MKVTREMRTAMSALAGMGVEFTAVHEKPLDCGCKIYGGWDNVKQEQSVRVAACSPEHEFAAGVAFERWDDPDVVERFRDVPAWDSCAALMMEAIEG